MRAVNPFDIARSHVRLPIHQDRAALKTALRDWLRYTEQTRLSEKDAFPAALCIEVKRPTPPPNALLRRSGSDLTGKRGAWRRRYGMQSSASRVLTGAAVEEPPPPLHLHRCRVPLALYTAVLPWEVQRGLSRSELTLPRGEGEEEGEKAGARTSETQRVEETAEGRGEEEEEDPFGVLTIQSGPSSGSSPSTSASGSSASASAPVPGMLFVLDLQGLRESHGQIGFWSGAITRPIDVLFFAPCEAAAVAQSTSFQRIRRRDVSMQVEGNEVSPEVVARFFPKNELRSLGRYELRLHTHGHLDPFPWCDERSTADNGGDDGLDKRRLSVEVPSSSLTSTQERGGGGDLTALPRIVLETVRHTLRRHVQRALRESLADYRGVYGDDGVATLGAAPEGDGSTGITAAGADLVISLELSDSLTADLMNKAQLHTEYVSSLESAVQRHARTLSQPLHSDAHEEQPAAEDADLDQGEGDRGGGESGRPERRMQVWLSEAEVVSMTPSELAHYRKAQMHKHKQTPWEAQREEAAAAAAEEEEWDGNAAYLREELEGELEEEVEEEVEEEDDGEGSHAKGLVAEQQPPQVSFLAPARAGAVRADKAIGRESPMLRDEDEGRPSSLAPSFTGKHTAPTLSQLRCVSADKLARYPPTRSEMPVLPPIDYELLDLCLRLGVGHGSVLYHYYERLLREWRQELKTLRSSSSPSSTESKMDEGSVQLMSALVHDPSLQVPEELRSLVDAVVAARRRQRPKEEGPAD